MNSDPMGALNAISKTEIPDNRHILLLGAGNAAGAVIYATQFMKDIKLTIASRNLKKHLPDGFLNQRTVNLLRSMK